jgi:hypothetical protein
VKYFAGIISSNFYDYSTIILILHGFLLFVFTYWTGVLTQGLEHARPASAS